MKENFNGKILFIVPNVGGQAYMIPKHPEQLEWTEKHLQKTNGADRI